MKKIFIFLPLLICAHNIDYIQNNIHTLTQYPNKFNLYINYLKVNKKLDVLNLRDKDLSSADATLGDLEGYETGLRYGLNSDLMYFISYTKQDIQFLGDTLTNKRVDTFFRYHMFESEYFILNSGVSVDFGYVKNDMDNFKAKNINTMNNLINRFVPNKDISIFYADGKTGEPFPLEEGYYLKHNNSDTKLDSTPYIGLKDMSDKSFYLRFLTGFYTSYNIFDFFVGVKRTKIEGQTDSTDELIRLAKDDGYEIIKKFDRYENSSFFGISDSLKYKKFVFEMNYRYIKLFRGEGLGYIKSNHILKANISYKLVNNIFLSLGGKIMYRQFNGEIPYLYNKATQTTFDHKYGYAIFGINFIY